ncbi:MAG: hypothetical protein WDA16_03165 [Candidatus Thermoplasmatota archaeon]
MTNDERDHVRISTASRIFLVTLARTIDARTLADTPYGHTVSFRKILDLVLIHHGHLPALDNERVKERLTHLREILATREPASLATGPVPRPIRPNARSLRRDDTALIEHASLIRALRRLVYTDKILELPAAYRYCEIVGIPTAALSPEGSDGSSGQGVPTGLRPE